VAARSIIIIIIIIIISFIIFPWGETPFGTAITVWSIVPAPHHNDDCIAIGGKRIGKENPSTRGKPAPVPLCPSQTPQELTRARTRATAVGNQQLTA
jgi:hypothetical protein